ncbi:hypothetical protein [Mycobacterium sp.]|uniref:hypothetical protein n=1 Tax=Mycobacterium sp. TaxID=1785 RepID=UPI002B72F430|nr:hypothetical protein [Mycobacterium sp.]HTQ22429.1 hypothetical protein [Mycobacterium sp.]
MLLAAAIAGWGTAPVAVADPNGGGAQWVETHAGRPGMFSVNLSNAQDPAIDPGTWVGTARSPDPNILVPCSTWQWRGEDRHDTVSMFATEPGESKVKFVIQRVPGHIQLSGDCDWMGGGGG